MAVRVLLMLAVLAVLYGCGQTSSPVEKQEKQEGVEQAQREREQPKAGTPSGGGQEETPQQVAGNIPIAGIVGENVETGAFGFRVLDYFVTDHYYYMTDPYSDDYEDVLPTAGQFVVVNYSVTNTGAETVSPNLIGALHVRAPDRKIEVYEQTDLVTPPHRTSPDLYLDDIPPRQMLVSQFIFDVPTDVEPELLAVNEEPTIATSYEVGGVDLTSEDPQGPRPEEMLALQYEYFNMTAYEQAYELFAQETKARVSEQAFASRTQQLDQENASAITRYSFPTVKIKGDHATIQVVRSYSFETEGERQQRISQEAVLEDAGWRIVMRDDQYRFYGG